MQPLVLLLAILVTSVTWAKDPAFPEYEAGHAKYLEALAKLQAERVQRLAPLNQIYAQRLEALRKGMAGDKEGTAAVVAEQGRLKLGVEPTTEERNAMPGLLRVQRTSYEKERLTVGGDSKLEAQVDAAWAAEAKRLYFLCVNPLSTDRFAREKAVIAHMEMDRLVAKAAGGGTKPVASITPAGPPTPATGPKPAAATPAVEVKGKPWHVPPTEEARKAAAAAVAKLKLNNPTKIPEAAEILEGALSRGQGLAQLKDAREVTLVSTHDAAHQPMSHNAGQPMVMRGTRAKEALLGRSGGILLFGPYETLQAGRFLIVYRYKFRGEIKGDKGCFLDVACSGNTVASTTLRTTATPTNEWVEVAVELKMNKPKTLEYRLWPGGNEVGVDRIYVYRLEIGS